MRLLPDYNFQDYTVTASSENSLFDADNLKTLDPMEVWRASAFSSLVTLTFDLGSPKPVNKIWLNNANFTTATIYAGASTSSWSVTGNVALKTDDAGITKGYFELSATNYRYVKISIPVQTLLKKRGELLTVPELGNVIIGNDIDLSPVASFEADYQHEYYNFTTDSGNYRKTERYKPRHILTLGFECLTRAEMETIDLTSWETAVIFSDLGNVSESFLVYTPEKINRTIQSNLNISFNAELEELV